METQFIFVAVFLFFWRKICKCQKNIANKSMQFCIKFVFPSGNRKCTKPKWKCSLKRLQNLLSEPWVKCLAVLSSFDFATCSAIAIHCRFSASTAPVPTPFQSTKMTNFEFIKITWNATLRAFWLRFSAEFTITDSDKDFPKRQAPKSLPGSPSPSLCLTAMPRWISYVVQLKRYSKQERKSLLCDELYITFVCKFV